MSPRIPHAFTIHGPRREDLDLDGLALFLKMINEEENPNHDADHA